MQDSDIQDLMVRTEAFAVRLLGQYKWRGRYGGVTPECVSAEDLTQFAFEKILAGAKWDEDKPLWLVLEGLVRGEVGNIAKGAENRRIINIETETHSNKPSSATDHLEEIPDARPCPASTLSRAEDDELFLNVVESLNEGTPERKIAEAIFGGAKKRSEIMTECLLDAATFEAAKKRLRRSLENYRQQLAAAHH